MEDDPKHKSLGYEFFTLSKRPNLSTLFARPFQITSNFPNWFMITKTTTIKIDFCLARCFDGL